MLASTNILMAVYAECGYIYALKSTSLWRDDPTLRELTRFIARADLT
jgi:hypothetical protein